MKAVLRRVHSEPPEHPDPLENYEEGWHAVMANQTKATESKENMCVGGRSDMSLEGLGRTFREHVFYTQGRFPKSPRNTTSTWPSPIP